MSAVVAHDVQLLGQLLDLGSGEPSSIPTLQNARDLAFPPGDQNGFYQGSLLLLRQGVGLLLGKLYPVLLRLIRGNLEDGPQLPPLVGNVRLPLELALDHGVQHVDGGWDGQHGSDQRSYSSHKEELASGY